ncbi:hypothetical protein PROFUN_14159 [Planoprotostelium fungivorum]|uniref:Uncharacterized protein n=1 Tax=Planoprotostelium fungivorum TaxID=1890364 RepID=A0A2P6N1P7_9EUKA|nr:hypothetical protein PROFUN_14159 [Planoprotostelium fungivorum]
MFSGWDEELLEFFLEWTTYTLSGSDTRLILQLDFDKDVRRKILWGSPHPQAMED